MDEQPPTSTNGFNEPNETLDGEPSRRRDDAFERMCAALASADARWTRRAAAGPTGDT